MKLWSKVATILIATLSTLVAACAQDPLPSWNDGPAKQAIIDFVKSTTDSSSAKFIRPEERVATFDQDGTTWVEQPFYAQLQFALARVVELSPKHPEWKTTMPFQAVLSGDKAALSKLTMNDLIAIVMATHTGMTVDQFSDAATRWLATAKDKRFDHHFTELVYEPMLEVMRYLRANGYKVYFVTGGGQAFVRTYSEKVYGVPPEQVIGSAIETQYSYDAAGNSVLMREPKLLLNDDKQGKPENIYLFTGRHPKAAFGNSDGDRQMLEYTQAGGGSLMMLVMHDDAQREYAYGPANGLPASKIGTFPQALYDEAASKGWVVISMKKDWRCIFAFEK